MAVLAEDAIDQDSRTADRKLHLNAMVELDRQHARVCKSVEQLRRRMTEISRVADRPLRLKEPWRAVDAKSKRRFAIVRHNDRSTNDPTANLERGRIVDVSNQSGC